MPCVQSSVSSKRVMMISNSRLCIVLKKDISESISCLSSEGIESGMPLKMDCRFKLIAVWRYLCLKVRLRLANLLGTSFCIAVLL